MGIWVLGGIGLCIVAFAVVIAPIIAGWVTMHRKSKKEIGDDDLH